MASEFLEDWWGMLLADTAPNTTYAAQCSGDVRVLEIGGASQCWLTQVNEFKFVAGDPRASLPRLR
eukprot:2701126-Prorocentrum_lima.AAC.1